MMQPPAPNDEPPPGYGTSDKLAPSRKGSEMSVSSKYALTPDPSTWGLNLLASVPDYSQSRPKTRPCKRFGSVHLHSPWYRESRLFVAFSAGVHWAVRFGSVHLHSPWYRESRLFVALALAFIGLFAVYPIVDNLTGQKYNTFGGYNLGGINASGQSAYTHSSIEDGSEYDLVFSDEFNLDGRSFYPGDDPFWEAVDLHYWGTNNLEWYSPDMVTTSNGYLNITLDKHKWNKLDYKGGMIASWNKFCFTGGYFVGECSLLPNVSLPGTSNVYGLWPAVWAMGNLGRAGYGASLDGTWPYTYIRILATSVHSRIKLFPTVLRLRRGPAETKSTIMHFRTNQANVLARVPVLGNLTQGQFALMGRSLDALRQKSTCLRHRSTKQSNRTCQSKRTVGAVQYRYKWPQTPENHQFIGNGSQLNTYLGGVYQQSTSGVTITNQDCYTQGAGCFSVYGFEYKPAMQADPDVKIGPRPVPVEPMYMLINLGISPNFGAIDWEHLVFPTWMLVDWIRVYQPKDNHNIGCDPPDFPTADYINTYIEAYSNPNLTTMSDLSRSLFHHLEPAERIDPSTVIPRLVL
ncbi:glycoside hydrolase family 16 protein [Ceratobasidium sp. AG-Ba]|nr:glycoside hydrolase family 16 protein [Ceratobasidium sp. AG-Ba]